MFSSLKMLFKYLIILTISLSDINCVDIKTSSGTVRGLTITALNKSVNQFLNIPYAEPPVRFAKPEPKKAVLSIIDGTQSGNSCFQNEKNPNAGLPLDQSEDCLALNVWSPSTANSSNLKPVMFWIYGGSLTSGSINLLSYNGSLLAAHDVVIVSANYRLGMFGWLYIDDHNSNFGFNDQLLALKWVRENIESFGGDPNQITLFGESAGSFSVSGHILSPLSRGLFQRAILESGAIFWDKDSKLLTKTQAIKGAEAMVRHFNCSGNQWIDCLRKVDAKVLSKYYDLPVYPVPDTEFLPMNAQKAFTSHNYSSDIDIMSGVMRNEGSILAHDVCQTDNITTVQAFRDCVRIVRDEESIVRNITEFYLKNVDTNNGTALRNAFYDFYGDIHMNCPTYLFAKRFAEESIKSKVFFYEWTHPGSFLSQFTGCTADMGVCHGSDIEYVFGLSILFDMPDKQFSLDVMNIWTNFAKNKLPMDSHQWPRLLVSKSLNKTQIREMNPTNDQIFENLFDKTCDGFWHDHFL